MSITEVNITAVGRNAWWRQMNNLSLNKGYLKPKHICSFFNFAWSFAHEETVVSGCYIDYRGADDMAYDLVSGDAKNVWKGTILVCKQHHDK